MYYARLVLKKVSGADKCYQDLKILIEKVSIMPKRLLGRILLLWLTIAAIAPLFIAPQVEAVFEDNLIPDNLSTLEQAGISLTLTDYQRGYLRSSADVHLIIANPNNAKLLYDGVISYDITHAPLSLSGLALAVIEGHNQAPIAGRYAPDIEADFFQLSSRIGLTGAVKQSIKLNALNRPIQALPFTTFDGISLNWHSHLKHYATQGNGSLQAQAIEITLANHQRLAFEPFTASLALSNPNAYHLTLPAIHATLHNAEQPSASFAFTNLSHQQHTHTVADYPLALARTLNIDSIDIQSLPLTQQPSLLSASNLHLAYGLQAQADSYRLSAQLTATTNPAANVLPLPEHTTIELDIAPIDQRLQYVWADLMRQPLSQPQALSINNLLTPLWALLADNMLLQDSKLTLKADLSTQQQALISADIALAEAIDSPAQLQALKQNGISPQHFHPSHANIFIDKDYLQRLKINPLLIIAASRYLSLDEAGNYRLDAEIADQILTLNGRKMRTF